MSTKYNLAILEADTLLRTLDIHKELIAQLKWSLEAEKDLIAEKKIRGLYFPFQITSSCRKA